MFDFLKRIFSLPKPEPAALPPTPPQTPAPPPAAAPVPATAAPPTGDEPVGEIIQVPFIDIVPKLSAALAPPPSAPLTGFFPLPVKTALAQLPSGAVRICFAQLRDAAPPGTFPDDLSFGETLVDLPLPKILAAINPALLGRRATQKQIEIPPEITGVFSGKGAVAAYAAAPVPVPAPVSVQVESLASFSSLPAALKLPVSAPLPFASQKPPSPPAPQALTDSAVTVMVSALFESWAEPVRQEIAESNLGGASVAIPMGRLDSGMKTGRIAFTWGEMMQWLNVPSAPLATSQRETVLELPLKVIAPLFMAQRKATGEQKKIALGENIPNLFAGLGQPAAAPAPVAAPPAPAAPMPSSAAVTLGSLLGQAAKTEWPPQEITQKLNTLPGVAASLIAMSDGLLVAGELPAPLKADTLAAFLPQIFGRMNHYAGEIHLGALSSLTLLAGQTPCAVFKTGTLYLAVLGKPGQPLPDALLQNVANEMAKRSQ